MASIHVFEINEAALTNLASKLSDFERQFTYPLGADRKFTISHGNDYTLFFRSIGIAATFVALQESTIAGLISVVLKIVHDQNSQSNVVAYICDLKIGLEFRGSFVLKALLQKAKEWIGTKCDKAFCVVMDGTSATPDRYTGRTEIPLFQKLASVVLLRITVKKPKNFSPALVEISAAQDSLMKFIEFFRGGITLAPGTVKLRSQTTPCYFTTSSPQGDGCGVLEDTRLAKRLLCDDGSEMVVGHLSSFIYNSLAAGIAVLQTALVQAHSVGIPLLFVPIPLNAVSSYLNALSSAEYEVIQAPASIYGIGFPTNHYWFINSSEI
jgi:hypothetical protein